MKRPSSRLAILSVALAGLGGSAWVMGRSPEPAAAYDSLLDPGGGVCSAPAAGRPALLEALVLAQATETRPFPVVPMQAADGAVPLYDNLGTLGLEVGTASATAQAYFDQGLRWAFAFNHAEAQRAFQAAQHADPKLAMAHWGEALVLGPNINAPMAPEALAPALAALARAVELAPAAPARDRALIAALRQRYSADPRAERAALDAAFADAMAAVARQYPDEDTIQALYAESIMDTQPWDYWEAAGTRPKGRAAEMLATLEKVLARNPEHPGAIHLYIHAVEASASPERGLPHARRLAALMPGAGHIVHMPAHIYYRVGLFKESLEANKRAMAVDEAYFATSPSDPLYKAAYYPHNIHFVLVSAQMGGDGATAIQAADRLDAALGDDVVGQFPVLEPIKAAPYLAHAIFSPPGRVLALDAPPEKQVLVSALAPYARALAHAARNDFDGAQREIAAIERIEHSADFQPYADWYVPGREIVQTAQLVASARLADARGDLAAAARAYEAAIAIEDSLAYMEPPYWYYPVRQSLGSVYLRQGRLDESEKVLRESLLRSRGNGWALAGLAEVYRRKGDRQAERATRQAYESAWFGDKAPDIARL
ncbi:tetratricopeptide repeat protein [Pseudoxanthomonas kaohsiungensis]|uniref:tetratricopeptide repeat protein n=1 Tax=Pseudoxanthomonas kaohsiungensis TaxID=283923 RepID=UPI0035B3A92F